MGLVMYHYHRCSECGTEDDCRDKSCETEEGYGCRQKGEDRQCHRCKAFPLIDLRAITREPDRYQTVIRLYHDHFRKKRWIIMGQARLTKQERSDCPSRWNFDSYLTAGVTDFEHDSAFAIRIPLVGVEFKNIYYGHAEFQAVIDPQDGDGFHVPPPGYNPMEHPEASQCKDERCIEVDGPHIIVPEGHYVPPTNKQLFQWVAGRFVEITFGVPPKEEP